MFGKLLGRSLILAAAIASGFSAAFVVSVVLFPSTATLFFLPFTAFTIAFGVAYVSIAVSLSAVTGSASRAATGAFAIFAVFTFVWEYVPNAVFFLLSGSLGPEVGEYPSWFIFMKRLGPNGAYDGTLQLVLDSKAVQTQLGGPVPVHLTWWVAVGVLCLWIIGPAWIGYVRFRAADL